MPSGIFVLPIEGTGTSGDPRRPKYLYHNVTDADGTVRALRPEVTEYHGSEEITKNGTDYMAVAVGTTTQGAYNQLRGQPDAYEIDGAEIAAALNATDTFPVDLTPREWGLVISRAIAAAGIS